eukprot:scaffold1771_cov211-Alexandrium_tamarense.AAC.45
MSSQTETEDTNHNTATLSKQRRKGRTAKNSGKEGDERELHVVIVRRSGKWLGNWLELHRQLDGKRRMRISVGSGLETGWSCTDNLTESGKWLGNWLKLHRQLDGKWEVAWKLAGVAQTT